MFYYYGRKKQIAKHYPQPSHPIIIEPFAGSAAYSLHEDNWKNEVILMELNKPVVDLWKYLQAASVGDIAGLPDVKEGDMLDSFGLSDEERLLLSVHVIPGATSPRNKVGKFSRWPAGKKYILENIHKIKHWQINHGDYRQLENIKATWFIDPPYKKAGKHYTSSTMDYTSLADWVKSRDGQIIACEGQEHGNYLPFEPLCVVNNGGMNKHKKSTEYVFKSEDVCNR